MKRRLLFSKSEVIFQVPRSRLKILFKECSRTLCELKSSAEILNTALYSFSFQLYFQLIVRIILCNRIAWYCHEEYFIPRECSPGSRKLPNQVTRGQSGWVSVITAPAPPYKKESRREHSLPGRWEKTAVLWTASPSLFFLFSSPSFPSTVFPPILDWNHHHHRHYRHRHHQLLPSSLQQQTARSEFPGPPLLWSQIKGKTFTNTHTLLTAILSILPFYCALLHSFQNNKTPLCCANPKRNNIFGFK